MKMKNNLFLENETFQLLLSAFYENNFVKIKKIITTHSDEELVSFLFDESIIIDNIDFVRIIFDEYQIQIDEDLIIICIKSDAIKIFNYLILHKTDGNMNKYFELACEFGSINIIKQLLTIVEEYYINEGFADACEYGHYNVVKYIAKNYDKLDYHQDAEYPFRMACIHEHKDIVKYLKKKFPDIDHNVLDNYCLRYTNDPEIRRWLETGCKFGSTKSAKKI